VTKKLSCEKTSQAYVKTRRNRTFGAMATAGAALLALNLSTDANAAIVTGTNFLVDSSAVNSPTLTTTVMLAAFDGKASWYVSHEFSWWDGWGRIIKTGDAIKVLSSGYLISAGRVFADLGEWTGLGGQSGYMGIKFDFAPQGQSAEFHYGWIDFSVNEAGNELTLNSWAYEDVEGKAIAAGDTGSPVPVPGSLALLASGATGLAALRRRKSAAA